MILDDKVLLTLPPPPPYASSPTHTSAPPPPFSSASAYPPHTPVRPLRFVSLPPHTLLQIVWATFPRVPDPNSNLPEGERKIFLWLAKSLRLVNKPFYFACMHVLRSTYQPAYTSLLRPFCSSDPFPASASSSSSSSLARLGGGAGGGGFNTIQRETPILDMYIALRVREDVCFDETELHLEREELFKDIFDHKQPKARLEDLVRELGLSEGVVTLAPPGVVVYSSGPGPGSGPAGGALRLGAGGEEDDHGEHGEGDAEEEDDGETVMDYKRKCTSKNTITKTSKVALPPDLRRRPQPQPPQPTSKPSPTSRFFKFTSPFRRHNKTPSPPASTTTIHPTSHSSHPSSPYSPSSHPHPHPHPHPPPPPPQQIYRPLPFSLLSITYSTRKVSLQLTDVETGTKRTVVEVPRMARDEGLEVTAGRVVRGLRGVCSVVGGGG